MQVTGRHSTTQGSLETFKTEGRNSFRSRGVLKSACSMQQPRAVTITTQRTGSISAEAAKTQEFGALVELDTSHWPNIAYTAYLMTGQYAYYEEQLMQSAYALGARPALALVRSRRGTAP